MDNTEHRHIYETDFGWKSSRHFVNYRSNYLSISTPQIQTHNIEKVKVVSTKNSLNWLTDRSIAVKKIEAVSPMYNFLRHSFAPLGSTKCCLYVFCRRKTSYKAMVPHPINLGIIITYYKFVSFRSRRIDFCYRFAADLSSLLNNLRCVYFSSCRAIWWLISASVILSVDRPTVCHGRWVGDRAHHLFEI